MSMESPTERHETLSRYHTKSMPCGHAYHASGPKRKMPGVRGRRSWKARRPVGRGLKNPPYMRPCVARSLRLRASRSRPAAGVSLPMEPSPRPVALTLPPVTNPQSAITSPRAKSRGRNPQSGLGYSATLPVAAHSTPRRMSCCMLGLRMALKSWPRALWTQRPRP